MISFRHHHQRQDALPPSHTDIHPIGGVRPSVEPLADAATRADAAKIKIAVGMDFPVVICPRGCCSPVEPWPGWSGPVWLCLA
jgi:hypothetical protein